MNSNKAMINEYICAGHSKNKKICTRENTENTKGNRIEFQVIKTRGEEGGVRKRWIFCENREFIRQRACVV